MRDTFDRRLTDPTAEEVASALVAAIAAVNAKHKHGNLPSIDSSARNIGRRVETEPEGRYTLTGSGDLTNTGRLLLAWWTNGAGRRLARVRGWREPDQRRGDPYAPGWVTSAEGLAYLESQRDLDARPKMWHVDHERVVETSAGGEPEWVAVCGCGAAGSPATLGWQHGMCGPCADRTAEFGPTAVTPAPGLLADVPSAPEAVAFAPDGAVLAGGSNWFRMWDAATGALLAEGKIGDEPELEQFVPQFRCSPDGRFVLVSTANRRLMLLKRATSRLRTTYRRTFMEGGAYWTGRPNELLFQSDENALLYLIDVTADKTRPAGANPDTASELSALWPDATAPRAVFAAGHRASVARVNADGTLAVEARFQLGDGRLNRTGLWHGGPEIVRFTPDGERLLFIRGNEMELRLPARPKALLQAEFPKVIRDACFAPDYEHLYLLTADGAIHVCNPGTLTSVRARLRWHVGPVSRLAISPDGETLATAGVEGVKLWPVARLLPLLV